jgi:hypothetical protein
MLTFSFEFQNRPYPFIRGQFRPIFCLRGITMKATARIASVTTLCLAVAFALPSLAAEPVATETHNGETFQTLGKLEKGPRYPLLAKSGRMPLAKDLTDYEQAWLVCEKISTKEDCDDFAELSETDEAFIAGVRDALADQQRSMQAAR